MPYSLASFRLQEISHNAVSLFRFGVEVAVPLPRKDDQLGIRNSLRQDVSAGAVRQVTDDEMIVVADEDQSRYFDVLQSPAGIMFLPGQHMAEIKLHGTEVGHSHIKVFLDEVGMLLSVGFGPTHDDGVLSHVFFIAHLYHLFSDS